MMKMNSIQFVLALLIVGLAAGCAEQNRQVRPDISQFAFIHTGSSFVCERDDVKYYVCMLILADERGCEKKGSVLLSSIAVLPALEKPRFSMTYGFDGVRGQTTKDMLMTINGKEMIAESDTLYFFQSGRVSFEKEYRILGIDAQHIFATPQAMRDHLQPILKT